MALPDYEGYIKKNTMSENTAEKNIRSFYQSIGEGKFKCNICNKEMTQGNMIRHIKTQHLNKIEKEGEMINTSFLYNGKPIPQKVFNLIVWKCRKGISLSALTVMLSNSDVF